MALRRVALLLVIFEIMLVGLANGQIDRTEDETRRNPKDIVDYYLIMPKIYFDDYAETSADFLKRQKCLESTKLREVVIDKGNAYIQIKDITNELEAQITIAYFIKTDGIKLIALSEYYEGGDCDDYNISFYEYVNMKWIEVTSEVLPGIYFKDFTDFKEFPEIENYMDIDKNIHWSYELPQYGTIIKVSPESLSALICFEYNLQTSVSDEDSHKRQQMLELYYILVKNRLYEYIELKWKRGQGIFEIGRKE